MDISSRTSPLSHQRKVQFGSGGGHDPQPDGSLDSEDVWLTGKRRYMGYADEIGESFTHIQKVTDLLGQGIGKAMGNPEKGRELANRRYNVFALGGGHSLTTFLGYYISYVYVGLNMITRAFHGWNKAREGGHDTGASALRVGKDLVGLGLFHYFATMLLAPKFLNKMGQLMETAALLKPARESLEKAVEAHLPKVLKPDMFRPGVVKALMKIPGVTLERLPKIFPWMQVALAIGLIPFISHPFDNFVQKVLDYTYRPLMGINKIHRVDKWYKFASTPNPEFWGTKPEPKPASRVVHLVQPHHRIQQKPAVFETLFSAIPQTGK